MIEYNCAMCKKKYLKKNDEEWNSFKEAEEFMTLTPECKNDRTVVVCDPCFKVYQDWLTNLTDEDRMKIRE